MQLHLHQLKEIYASSWTLRDFSMMRLVSRKDRDLDHKMARALCSNAIGPALIMKHVLPLLPAERPYSLPCRLGWQIGDNSSAAGTTGLSKAALNQLVRTAAIELRRLQPEAYAWHFIPARSIRHYLRLLQS